MIKTEQAPNKYPAGKNPSVLSPQSSVLIIRAGVLLALFSLALVAFNLAWQIRPSYRIDLGERLDRPFVADFNDREPSEKDRLDPTKKWDGTSWRWSVGESEINLPGLGSQPLSVTVRFNPVINPNPGLEVFANNNPVGIASIKAGQGWTEQSFKVPAEVFPTGNLQLKFKTAIFKAPGDKRELGLAFDWLRVEPAPVANGGAGRAPDRAFWLLVFIAVLAGLIFLTLGLPSFLALGAGGLAIAGLVYWLSTDRLSLTVLLERDLIASLIFLEVAAVLISRGVPPLLSRLGVAATRREGGWLATLFLLQFSLLYFAQIHPQFISSDLGLGIHDVQRVAGGQAVFTHELPDGRPAPYPPALYFLLLPFTIFSGMDDKPIGELIILANSLLAASGGLLVYYIAAHFWQSLAPGKTTRASRQAGLIAAALYAISRYPYYIFSQGNHTNLFGTWAFLLFLAILTGVLQARPLANELSSDKTRAKPMTIGRYFLPVAALVLVFLAHYGTFLFANGFILAFAVSITVLGGRQGWRTGLYLLGIWLLGLGIAFGLYYYNFTGLLTAQFGGAGNKTSSAFNLLNAATNIYRNSREDFGLLVILAAVGGGAVWVGAQIIADRRRWWQLTPVGGLLLALLGTCAVFALAEALQGLPTRYQLYLVPAVAVLAGGFLARLWGRGWAGIMAVTALFLFQFLNTLLFWLDRVLYYFL